MEIKKTIQVIVRVLTDWFRESYVPFLIWNARFKRKYLFCGETKMPKGHTINNKVPNNRQNNEQRTANRNDFLKTNKQTPPESPTRQLGLKLEKWKIVILRGGKYLALLHDTWQWRSKDGIYGRCKILETCGK